MREFVLTMLLLAGSVAMGGGSVSTTSEPIVVEEDACANVRRDCHAGEDSVYNTCREKGGAILICLHEADAYYRACMKGTGCGGY